MKFFRSVFFVFFATQTATNCNFNSIDQITLTPEFPVPIDRLTKTASSQKSSSIGSFEYKGKKMEDHGDSGGWGSQTEMNLRMSTETKWSLLAYTNF